MSYNPTQPGLVLPVPKRRLLLLASKRKHLQTRREGGEAGDPVTCPSGPGPALGVSVLCGGLIAPLASTYHRPGAVAPPV